MAVDQRNCANCGVFACLGNGAEYPSFCLTTNTDPALLDEALEAYAQDEQTALIARCAAEVEGEYYGGVTRIEEICLFAKKIGAERIGIASCRGLASDARLFAKVLRAKGFEAIEAVVCKVGCTDKSAIGVAEESKVHPGQHESMCNPIAQAKILAEKGTDLNVICGLCVGHDTLFMQHSAAPCTYLVVKDRVTCHNPVAPLHAMDTYYKRLLDPELPSPTRH